MKKLTLLSSVIVLAACGNNNNTATTSSTTSQATTTAQTNTQTTDTSALKTFNFSNSNLAVKASSKWIKIKQLDEAALELTGYAQKAYIGFSILDKKDTITTNFDDLSQLVFDGAVTSMEYNTALDIKSGVTANIPTRYTQFKHTFQGEKLNVLLYLIDNGENYIYTVITVEENTYPKIADEISAILNSIHKP